MLPDRWKTYKLNQVTSKIGDGLHGTPVYDETGEYYFINGSNLVDGKIDMTSNTKRVSEEEYNKYKKELSDRTILLGINGTIGNVALYNNEKCVLSKSAAYLNTIDNFDKGFLKYILLNDHFQKYIKTKATGTTIKNVGLALLREYEFWAPESLETQRSIASILSSLDDKIGLNLQMNKTLGAIAQAMFKEWFVNFRFPGLDGIMEDGVPKGWSRISLKKLSKRITKGTTPTTLKKEYTDKGVNFIKVESIDDDGNIIYDKISHIDQETNQLLKRSIIEENDILFTIAGTLGRVAKADKSILPANTNQAVAIIRLEKSDYTNLVYLYLRLSSFRNQMLSKAVHAVQANLSLSVLGDSEIVIPDDRSLKDFNLVIDSIFNKIKANTYEIRTLTSIRDSLLPKLMTGRIRVV